MTMFPESVSTPDGKVKGSFSKSPNAVNEQIKRDRADAAVKAKELEDKERDRLASENTGKAEEVGEQPSTLPKFVDSAVYGRLTFDHFKEKYLTIFEQIRDKVHLTKGAVDFHTEISGQKISLSSLTKGQQRFVNYIARGDASMTRMPSLDEQEEFGRWFLLVSITAAGATDVRLPKPPRISSSEFEKESTDKAIEDYLKNEKVRSKLVWLDDLANEVYQHLFNVVTDLMTAVYLAVREDILNP